MAPLVGGSALTFALVKVGLTAGGVLLLTQLARLRAFGASRSGCSCSGPRALRRAHLLRDRPARRSLGPGAPAVFPRRDRFR